MATSEYGAHLNTVEDRTCPTCSYSGPIAIYENAVRWARAHTRSLPPLRMPGGRPPRAKGEER
jgi:hypothetical protein